MLLKIPCVKKIALRCKKKLDYYSYIGKIPYTQLTNYYCRLVMSVPNSEIRSLLDLHVNMQPIMQTILHNTPIKNYNYVKIDTNNTRIFLGNSPAWADYYLNHYKLHESVFELDEIDQQHKYIVWDNCDEVVSDKFVQIAREQFNIDHGFTIIDNYKNYSEYHYFSTENTILSNMNQYYINNIDRLYQIINQFKYHCASLIEDAEKNPCEIGIDKNIFNNRIIDSKHHYGNMLKHEIVYNKKKQTITKRELECLALSYWGLSCKEISRVLHISYRTVQAHTRNVKVKFCLNRNDFNNMIYKTKIYLLFDSIYYHFGLIT